jgi:hypothetical protein
MRSLVQERVLRLMRYPPPSAMTIDNLYAYLDALYHCRNIEGPVVEIGCARGGTTITALRFLSRIGCRKEYYCLDTFGGFVDSQLETDHRLGLTERHDRFFSDNSRERVQSTLAAFDIREHVHLIQADICKVDPSELPDSISVALVDVDLRDPVYAALEKLYPRLADGGVMVVDDCKAGTAWVGADVGYRDFVTAHGLQPNYFMGFGVVIGGANATSDLGWEYSSAANPIVPNFYG